MEYEKFKEEIRKELQGRLGAGTEIIFHNLERNNGIKEEGLEVREKGRAAAPVLHLDELYKAYCGSGSMEEAANCGLRMLERKPTVDAGAVPKTWAAARGRVRAELVHYGWNREGLEGIPHRKFLNLAVIYRMQLALSGSLRAGIRINNGLIQAWGATEEDLYRAAMGNMEKEGYRIQPLAELLGRMAGIQPGEMPELPEEMRQQYVLTNGACHYGAAGMLWGELMEGFAEQAGGNFYILPSSVHDLILLPDSFAICTDSLREMVKEVNESTVAREEWLSQDVYYYDSGEKRVRIAP
mgnify:FL=1